MRKLNIVAADPSACSNDCLAARCPIACGRCIRYTHKYISFFRQIGVFSDIHLKKISININLLLQYIRISRLLIVLFLDY